MADLADRRAAEVDKYRRVYERLPTYGDKTHGRYAITSGLIAELAPASIIDVGCGSNLFCREVSRTDGLGIPSNGVDLVCPQADTIAPAHDLPFRRDSFDLLTAFDVLEHLLPEEIHEVLGEWRRVSSRFLFSINHGRSHARGDELHMTIKDATWWRRTIEAHAGGVERRARVEKTYDPYWLGVWKP